MKKILFPTDFSYAADNALNYAIAFARKMKSKLILFNTYPIPVYVTDVPVETAMNEKIKTEAETSLKELEKRVHKMAPDIETEYMTSWGFAADEILFQAKEKKIDLIIMGTQGASSMKRILLGSNTADVVNRSSCPVLAIPDGCAFQDFQHIAFATDCSDNEIPSIKTAIEFAKQFKSDFTLVHISDGVLNTKLEQATLENFRDKVRKQCDFQDIEIEMVEMPNIIKGLTDTLVEDEIDLMVIAHKKRNFLAQFISPSISKRISYRLASPLLSLPVK